MSPRSGADGDPTPALEFVAVVKDYAGSPPVRALDGVSLRVRSGELFAVVGQSGSGKSTLLNLAGALDRPTSGTVRIDGDDVSRLSDARLSSLRSHRIGFVFQQFVLIDGFSALANVATGLLYQGLPAAVRRARAVAALERVGLGHRARHRPGELSGGEQQRVAIARALISGPSIVLADEPTGNVDSATGQELVQLLRDLHREGATIGVVTHDRALAAALPRVITIRDGRIASDSAVGAPA
ncbi:MAG TPA: ABC transporter ATP-binding protein [Euzebyales bacterium]|nr:ABC transporter ATP-binding protein [Euzebyales bacterium]